MAIAIGIKKNAISNFLLNLFKLLLPMATFPYLTRVLSKEAIGNVFFIDSIIQYLLIFVSLGIPFYGIREIAKNKGNAEVQSKIALELVLIQLGLSLFAILFLLSLPLFIHQLRLNETLIKIGCISIISSSFLIEWYYQGIEKYVYITYRSIITKLLGVAAIFFLVKSPSDDKIYYLISNLIIVTNSMINFFYFIKNSPKVCLSMLRFKDHIKPLLVLFCINVSISIYSILDTIILGFLKNTQTVSLYYIPSKIVKIYWSLIISIGFVLIPKISQYFASKEHDKINSIASSLLNIILMLTAPFMLFCLIIPKEIIQFVAGDKYEMSSNVLRILSSIPLIISVCNLLSTQFLLPIGQEKKILHATILGLLISLTTNFILVLYFAHIGTAIAYLLTEIVVFVYIYLSSKTQIKMKVDNKLFLNILLTSFTTVILYLTAKSFTSGSILMAIVIASYFIIFFILYLTYFRGKYLSDFLTFEKK